MTRTVRIGIHRGRPRLWLEGAWLADAGFLRGLFFQLTPYDDTACVLALTKSGVDHRVSGKRKGAGEVSVIDVNSWALEPPLVGGGAATVTVVSKGRLLIRRVTATEAEVDAEVTRAEDAVEDGQARWGETGSTRRR